MIERYEKSFKAISALSLVGWALFVVLSAGEFRGAIVSALPGPWSQFGGPLFWLMVAAFLSAGVLVLLPGKGLRIADVSMRLILGGIFLAAAVPKILDPAGFALDISHYDFFPKSAINIIAITVPWIELLVALSLIFRVGDAGGILIVNLMMLAFLVLLGQAWYRGLNIDCGCFGHSDAQAADAKATVAKAFVRDLFFVAWSVLLYLFSKKQRRSGTV